MQIFLCNLKERWPVKQKSQFSELTVIVVVEFMLSYSEYSAVQFTAVYIQCFHCISVDRFSASNTLLPLIGHQTVLLIVLHVLMCFYSLTCICL